MPAIPWSEVFALDEQLSLIVPDCHDRRLPDCTGTRELSVIPATTSLEKGDTFLLRNIFAFVSWHLFP